jgi:hypothetical protein
MLQPQLDHGGINIILKATGTVSNVNRKAPAEAHRALGSFLAGDTTSIARKKVTTKNQRCAPKQLHTPAREEGGAGWRTTPFTWQSCHTEPHRYPLHIMSVMNYNTYFSMQSYLRWDQQEYVSSHDVHDAKLRWPRAQPPRSSQILWVDAIYDGPLTL